MIGSLRSRHREWLLAGAGLLASAALLWSERTHPVVVGSRLYLPISIVPSDVRDLDCAAPQSFDTSRCAFDSAKVRTGADRPLRPFVTTYGQIVALSGVFETANVSAYLARAKRENDDARVTLDCDGVILGTMPTVGVHWHEGAAFDMVENIPVGRVRSCNLDP
jgi:hypothetical protein